MLTLRPATADDLPDLVAREAEDWLDGNRRARALYESAGSTVTEADGDLVFMTHAGG